SRAHPSLHSFPTRRSSDLVLIELLTAHGLDREGEGGDFLPFVLCLLCQRRTGEEAASEEKKGCSLHGGGVGLREEGAVIIASRRDRKSTRLNSSHVKISYA